MHVKQSCCCCLTSWAHVWYFACFSNMQTVDFNVEPSVFSVSHLDLVKLMVLNAKEALLGLQTWKD